MTNLAKPWDETDDHELEALGRLTVDALKNALGAVGHRVTEIEEELDEVRWKRTLIILALEPHDLSYRELAQIAGGISDVAIIRALQRLRARRFPEPVA